VSRTNVSPVRIERTESRRRIALATLALESATGLHALPHPIAARAERGETLYDYCDYMLSRPNDSGRLVATRIIERVTKGGDNATR